MCYGQYMGVVQRKPQMTTTPPPTSIASLGIFKDCHVVAIADLEEPDEFNPHNQGKTIPKGKAKSKGNAKANRLETHARVCTPCLVHAPRAIPD